jgi:hypothetical protein
MTHAFDPGDGAPPFRPLCNRWLDALLAGRQVEAMGVLGALADRVWAAWKGGLP